MTRRNPRSLASWTIVGKHTAKRMALIPICCSACNSRTPAATATRSRSLRRTTRFSDLTRTIADKATGAKVTPDYPLISDDELKRLVDDCVRVAKLAVEVGFDFLDVKQCHRYLANELLGAEPPRAYGGSFENRTRFAPRGVSSSPRAVRAGIVMPRRMNVYDGIPFHKAANADGARTRTRFRWRTVGACRRTTRLR